MQQVGGIHLAEILQPWRQLGLGVEHQGIGLAQAVEQRPGSVERRLSIPARALQAAHAVLERQHRQPAGQGVVGEVKKTTGPQGPLSQAHQAEADRRRDPAQDSMGHGEVEFAPGHAAASGLLQLQKIGLLETHVAQAGGRRQGAGVGDVLGVEVDAEEAGLGIVRRLQAEVVALATTELEQLEGPADLRGPVPVQ